MRSPTWMEEETMATFTAVAQDVAAGTTVLEDLTDLWEQAVRYRGLEQALYLQRWFAALVAEASGSGRR